MAKQGERSSKSLSIIMGVGAVNGKMQCEDPGQPPFLPINSQSAVKSCILFAANIRVNRPINFIRSHGLELPRFGIRIQISKRVMKVKD